MIDQVVVLFFVEHNIPSVENQLLQTLVHYNYQLIWITPYSQFFDVYVRVSFINFHVDVMSMFLFEMTTKWKVLDFFLTPNEDVPIVDAKTLDLSFVFDHLNIQLAWGVWLVLNVE
jgi:hypothetical protein